MLIHKLQWFRKDRVSQWYPRQNWQDAFICLNITLHLWFLFNFLRFCALASVIIMIDCIVLMRIHYCKTLITSIVLVFLIHGKIILVLQLLIYEGRSFK